MVGEENSLVERTGEVIGECEDSLPLGSRGFDMRRGDGGGGIPLAGECWRLVPSTLGRIKLLRFRSRDPASRDWLSSAFGESALRGNANAEDRTLLSLSAPVSLSNAMEPRLPTPATLAVPACDLGVREPDGLLDRVDEAA